MSIARSGSCVPDSLLKGGVRQGWGGNRCGGQ